MSGEGPDRMTGDGRDPIAGDVRDAMTGTRPARGPTGGARADTPVTDRAQPAAPVARGEQPSASKAGGGLPGTPDAGATPELAPDDPRAAGYLFGNLLRFGRLLHALGLDVQAGGMLDVAEALGHVDVGRRADFYHTLQTLLVRRAQDLPIFDEAFRLFWRPPRGERSARDLRAMGERRRFAPPEVDVPPDAPPPTPPTSARTR